MLLPSRRREHFGLEPQPAHLERRPAEFAAPDALAALPAADQFPLGVLAQTRPTISGDDVGGWDVPDYPVDPAVARDGRLEIYQQGRQLLRRVRPVAAAQPEVVQLGVGQELA